MNLIPYISFSFKPMPQLKNLSKILLAFSFLGIFSCTTEVKSEFSATNSKVEKSEFPYQFISFRHFGVDEGMPEASAYDLVTDKFGYTWCRTQRGLARFENNGFRAFTHSINDSTTILNNVIDLVKNDQDELVAISREGLSIFDHSSNSFTRQINPIYDDTLNGTVCYVSNTSLWDISSYDRKAVLSFVKNDKSYTLQDTIDDFQGAEYFQIEDGKGYFLVQNTKGRSLYYTNFKDESNIEFTTVYVDSIRSKAKPISSDGLFYLRENDAVLWDGRSLMRLQDEQAEEFRIPIEKYDSIVGCSFHQQKNHESVYVLLNYSDNSCAVFEATASLDSFEEVFYEEGDYIYHAALNSKDDIVLSINEGENYKKVIKDEFVICVKQDRSSRRFTSNIPPEHITKGRAIHFDQSDNFWYGTWRKGIYVYSEDQQAFRKRGTQLTAQPIGVTYYPVWANADTTFLLSSKGVMHVPRLGKTVNPPVENVYVRGVKKCGRNLVIAAGSVGVLLYNLNTHEMEQILIPSYHNPERTVIVQYAMIDSKDRLWTMGYNGFNVMSRNPKTNKFDPKTLLHRCKETQKTKVMNRSAPAGIYEYNGEIYISVQMTPQILKFNEKTLEFERTKSPNLLGIRLPYVDSEGHHWFTSYRMGVFEYDMENHKVLREFNRENGKLPTSFVKHFQFVGENNFLVRGEAQEWYLYDLEKDSYRVYDHYQEFNWHLWNWEPVIKSDSLQLLPGTDCIYQLNKNYKEKLGLASLRISSVQVNGEPIQINSDQYFEELSEVHLPYDQNNLQIRISDQNPHDNGDFVYEYILEGLDDQWKETSSLESFEYNGLAPGNYTFKVRLTAANGDLSSEPLALQISVSKPWWLSIWAFIAYLLCLGLFIYLLVRWRTGHLRKKQIVLEGIISEKTKDIREQKEEIEEKQKEILDSITYAKRIQSAIMPPEDVVNKLIPENFISYLPKDIVAGDFYWFESVQNKVLFAAADCTGHGVPGAMVSVVCNNGLNRSVREYGLLEPGEILDKTRELVISEFEEGKEKVKDGMDIALCSLEGKTLKYAGAHNPLWIIRNGSDEIEEYKANKQPIGQFDNPTPYTTHTIQMNKGDQFYIFSDGYADQFGGEKGKKFKASNFKKLLLTIKGESMATQKQKLEQRFNEWKGELEQLDDVCIIGVRI